MPWVAGAFMVGAVAIVGLPPLNGFASEFLIYLGAFRGEALLAPDRAVPCLLVIAALALIGGLAAVCFTKVVGVVFLGEPRTEQAAAAHRPGWLLMTPADVVLAAGCLLVGLAAPWIVVVLGRRSLQVSQDGAGDRPPRSSEGVTEPLFSVAWAAAVLIVLALALAVLRRALAGRSRGGARGDLGLWLHPPHRPHAVHGILLRAAGDRIFRGVSPHPEQVDRPDGTVPPTAAFSTETADPCTEVLYRPAFRAFGRAARAAAVAPARKPAHLHSLYRFNFDRPLGVVHRLHPR